MVIFSRILRPLLLMIFINLISTVHSQIDSSQTKLSYWDKNFFQTIGFSIMLDAGQTPFYYKTYHLTDPNDPNNDTDVLRPFSELYNTLLSVKYEPRINLVSIGDFFSISMNIPVASGFVFFSGRGEGFGIIKSAMHLDLNFFNHSTYNNINRYGFNFGFGYQTNYGPLIPSRHYDAKKLWGNLEGRIGFKFLRKKKNHYIDFMYYPGRSEIDPSDNDRKWEKQSFSIYYGFILNYD